MRIKTTSLILFLLCTLLIVTPLSPAAVAKPKPILQLDKSNLVLDINNSYTLNITTAKYFDSPYLSIEWTTNKKSVATVHNGKVKAVGPGKALITAKVYGQNTYAQTVVTVTDKKVPDSIYNHSVAEQALYAIEKYSSTSDHLLTNIEELKNRSKLSQVQFYEEHKVFNTINKSVQAAVSNYQLHSSLDENGSKRIHVGHYINGDFYPVSPPLTLAFDFGNGNNSESSPQEDAFNTVDFDASIDDELKTPNWKLSIGNLNGVYSFLNSYESDYYGVQAVYDVYPFLADMPFDQDIYGEYIQSLNGSGYYEYTFMTLAYLIYAKENHPDIYRKIMDSKDYKTAFQYFHTNYSYYVEQQLPKRIQTILSDLKNRGVKASINADNYVVIDGTFYSTSDMEVSKLQQVLNTKPYKEMLKELLTQ